MHERTCGRDGRPGRWQARHQPAHAASRAVRRRPQSTLQRVLLLGSEPHSAEVSRHEQVSGGTPAGAVMPAWLGASHPAGWCQGRAPPGQAGPGWRAGTPKARSQTGCCRRRQRGSGDAQVGASARRGLGSWQGWGSGPNGGARGGAHEGSRGTAPRYMRELHTWRQLGQANPPTRAPALLAAPNLRQCRTPCKRGQRNWASALPRDQRPAQSARDQSRAANSHFGHTTP